VSALLDTPTVATTGGRVAGERTATARVFRDIPYAAPPVGPLRFAEPRPHPGWSGVRDGTRQGPNAPQPARGRIGDLDLSPFFGSGWVRGDDHLTVNVWAPLDPGPPAPVVVFVHGGAFVAGSTGAPAYDGSAFARDGVVFVTVNYRLGVPGFLSLPDAPENRGRLDVLAALRWVRENAPAFGGDPGAVTLAGQSAGAIIVTSIVDAPDAGELRGAIVSSGSGIAAFAPEQAAVVRDAVGRELGVEPSAAGLADVADERLVDVLPRLAGLPGAPAPLAGITPFSVVLDRQPVETVTGSTPLLIGSNRDESSFYLSPPDAGEDDDDLVAVAARFHPDPGALVAQYRAERPAASTAELAVVILSDGMFRTGTRRYAEAHAAHRGAPTYVYEFGWRSDALGGHLGCCHLMDLPFAFDRVDLRGLHGPARLLGTTPPPPDLAKRIHGAWVRFAGGEDPDVGSFSTP
jgi:para-nitrobenzyl esterase